MLKSPMVTKSQKFEQLQWLHTRAAPYFVARYNEAVQRKSVQMSTH